MSHRRAIIISIVVFTLILTTSGSLLPVALTPVDNAQETGAVCSDGSTPQYQLDRGSGTGADSWIIYLEGGAWCGTVESCYVRSMTWIGSSKYMTPVLFEGILSPVQAQNPEFYNWNRVFVRYCDGAAFSGNVDGEVDGPNGTKLFFRGQRIWEAVMSDLIFKGLGDAKQALLSGCSAGGHATLLHCDSFHRYLPNVGTVKCLSDAGLFLDEEDISGKRTMYSMFKDTIYFQNVTKTLQEDCLSTEEPTECFFPREIIKHITTPLFVLNSAYDYWQIRYALAPFTSDPDQEWLSCKNNINNCDAKQIQVLQEFRTSMLDSLKEFQNNQQAGLFINSCFAHCQAKNKDGWYSPESPTVNNKTIAEAVGDWFFNRSEVKEVDCPYPCNHSCDNVKYVDEIMMSSRDNMFQVL